MNNREIFSELTYTTQSATEKDILAFEELIGTTLPKQYRHFLTECNGGRVGGPISGGLWFDEQTSVKIIGGIRQDKSYSLAHYHGLYQGDNAPRIPLDLIWIMSGVFGNHICLGIRGNYRGQIFFWDHEQEPEPGTRNGSVENSPNIFMLAETFSDFIENLVEESALEEQKTTEIMNDISWQYRANFPDGRKFITDKNLILDMAYLSLDKEPQQIISHQQIERLFTWETTIDFGLNDLTLTASSGNFWAPNNILLSKKYLQILQTLTPNESIRFYGSQPHSPVLIFDGDQIIGALMPMKLTDEN